MLVLILFFPLALISFKVFLAFYAKLKVTGQKEPESVNYRLKATLFLVPFLILPMTMFIILMVTFFETLLMLDWTLDFVILLIILFGLFLIFRRWMKRAIYLMYRPHLLIIFDDERQALTKFHAIYAPLMDAIVFPIFLFLIGYMI